MKLLRLMLVGSVVITSGTMVAAAYGLAVPTQEFSEHEKLAEKPILLAQLYDPGEEIYQDNMVRVYIDPMGRRITMDQYGKIIQVEEQAVGNYGGRRSGLRQSPGGGEYSSSGRGSYGRFSDVPDNPGIDYYPAPPSSGQPGFGREHKIDRAELPPPGVGNNNAALGGNGLLNDGWGNDDWGSAEPLEPEYGNLPSGLPGPHDMTPAVEMPKGQDAKVKLASYQVLLSRAGTSPGVIDGRAGSNVEKAAASYREITGEVLDPNNVDHINSLLEASGGPAFTQYQITNEDIGRFYIASVPSDYAEKAKLEEMAYVSPREMLAERFHVDENYLQELNPGVTFRHPGEVITVPNIVRKKRTNVARIIADKGRKQVRGYDEAGNLVVAYPSTIGSSDNPSPSGIVTVERIATNPNYTYNPKLNFKQGNNDKVLTIPPGPNGPVGTVWIALSKPTYGIHGTPDPSRIGKTSSHGCVRLTNWDAEELVKLVKPGVVVEFID